MNPSFKNNILLHLMYWGPLETFILNQLHGLGESFNPSITALHHYKEFTGGIYKGRKVEILNSSFPSHVFHSVWQRVNFNENKYAAFPLRQKKLERIIARENIQLIHAHYGQMGLNILPAAVGGNIPLLTTFHGNDASSLLGVRRYRSSLPSLFRYRHSYIIAVSERIRMRLVSLGAPEERTFCHYIGTDTDRFQPGKVYSEGPLIKKQKVNFLQISNFVEKKGHIYTIEAFNRLVRKYSHVFLTLAGEGIMRKACESRVRSLGLEDRVKFTGRIEHREVKRYMEESDIFVHHSIIPSDMSEEGIPTVVMEAMACGLPVLSTFHAGIPELVEDGVNGFLAEERNVEQYEENMEKMLWADWQKMSLASRAVVERKFDVSRQNRELEKIYSGIIQKSLT